MCFAAFFAGKSEFIIMTIFVIILDFSLESQGFIVGLVALKLFVESS